MPPDLGVNVDEIDESGRRDVMLSSFGFLELLRRRENDLIDEDAGVGHCGATLQRQRRLHVHLNTTYARLRHLDQESRTVKCTLAM